MSSLRGVDVSSFNGTPAQWAKAAGPIDFAAVKITELEPNGNHYLNPRAAEDWAYLRELDKLRTAYMFGHPSTSPSAAIEFFAQEIERLGLADGDAVSLDHEVSDGLTAIACASWGRAVLAALQEHFHRIPLLYTFRDFAETGHCAGMGAYPLWLADPDAPAGRPHVPAPWDTHVIHQYVVGGVIDRDQAKFTTPAAFRERLGRQAPKEKSVLYVTDGKKTLAQIGHLHHCEPMHLLRLTVLHHAAGVPANVAAYVNGVFRGEIPVDRHVPASLHLYVPSA